MTELNINAYHLLNVVEIIPAADNFRKGSTGTIAYCHFLSLSDEKGIIYNSQICDENTTQNYCSVGDTVKVKMKSLTKGRYTIESLSVNSRPNQQQHQYVHHSQQYAQPSNSQPAFNTPPYIESKESNQLVAGRMSSVALNAAVLHFQGRVLEDETNPKKEIIELAESFYKFLQEKRSVKYFNKQ